MKFFSRDRFLEFDLDIYPIGKRLGSFGLIRKKCTVKLFVLTFGMLNEPVEVQIFFFFFFDDFIFPSVYGGPLV